MSDDIVSVANAEIEMFERPSVATSKLLIKEIIKLRANPWMKPDRENLPTEKVFVKTDMGYLGADRLIDCTNEGEGIRCQRGYGEVVVYMLIPEVSQC